MKKKIFNPSYFLINFNQSYSYSFGCRLVVVGINVWIVGYAMSRLYFSSFRAKALKGESFD